MADDGGWASISASLPAGQIPPAVLTRHSSAGEMGCSGYDAVS